MRVKSVHLALVPVTPRFRFPELGPPSCVCDVWRHQVERRGCVAMWVCGCSGMWVYGRVGVWVGVKCVE